MISSKTAAILLFIALNMRLVASTSPRGTKRRRSLTKPTSTKKQKCPSETRVTAPMLQDTNNETDPVEFHRESTGAISTSHKLSIPQVDNPFKTFIEQEEYWEIFKIGDEMNNEEFLKQLCQAIVTFGQYKGIVDYLKNRKMVASFYMHGNIEVVKKAIIESGVYDNDKDYVKDGDLETALPLVLKEDNHDRVIELLKVRKELTAEKDEQFKKYGMTTSLKWFMCWFLENLAPWEDGMALRRFLILRGEELRNKYHDILDALCQWLVDHLSLRLRLPKAESLLADLVGQPSLLTPVIFMEGFLEYNNDEYRSAFIKYGWREVIQKGLNEECHGGGEELWRVMQKEKPDKFPGEFAKTEKALAAVLKHFPTKQEKEDEWIKNNEEWFKENALILYNKLKPHDDIFNLLPGVLWLIISEYALYIS